MFVVNILSEWISADKNSNNVCLTHWFLLAKYSATFFLNVDKFCRPFILSGRSFHCYQLSISRINSYKSYAFLNIIKIKGVTYLDCNSKETKDQFH